jgi:hypothetical protein
MIAGVHLTGHELILVPSAVAAVAIVGGYAGVRSANSNQRAVIREQYVRDHLTETYLLVLRAVHFRGVLVDEHYRMPPGGTSVLPTRVNQATAEEAEFGARLLAHASQEVYDLWYAYCRQTDELIRFLDGLRQEYHTVPAAIPGMEERADAVEANRLWQKAREDLVNRIRQELEFEDHHRLRLRLRRTRE